MHTQSVITTSPFSITENATKVIVEIDKKAVAALNGHGKTEYITVDGNKAFAVVPVDMYERLIEELEDYEDAEAVREARAEGGEPMLWEDIKKANGWE